jgi:hypothetical protein
MATLKRIGPGSAFKVGLVTYAILGLFVGVIMACLSMVAGSLAGLGSSGTGARAFGFGFGFGAIIVFPIAYGIIGAIGGAIGAAIYNLVAGWIGGLEVDIG